MVAIYERSSRSDPNKLDFICGGSLISSKAVVTGTQTTLKNFYIRISCPLCHIVKQTTVLFFPHGASLIAAHCVVRRDNGQKKRLNELKIVVGKYYRSYERQSTGEQESDIGDVYVHPEYNRVTLNSDIAIIKLAKVNVMPDKIVNKSTLSISSINVSIIHYFSACSNHRSGATCMFAAI